MKEINTDTVLGRLYSHEYYGNGFTGNTNVCIFARKVFKGIAAAFLWVVLGIFFGLGVLEFIVAPTLWAFTDNGYQFFLPPPLIGIALIAQAFVAFFGVVIGIVYLKDLYDAAKLAKIQTEGYVEPEPSIISLWLKGIKNKICFQIKVTNGPKEK